MSVVTLLAACNKSDDSSIDNAILSKIDNSLKQDTSYYNKMNGVLILGGSTRLSSEIMKDKLVEFNTAYKEAFNDLPKYRPSQWSKEGVIETDFDGDDIVDYLVLTEVLPTPMFDGGYKVYAIKGKDYKMYLMESFSLFKEGFYYEDEGTVVTSKNYEILPYIMINKEEGTSTYFIQRNPNEEVYNPFYYEPDTDSFEVLLYD